MIVSGTNDSFWCPASVFARPKFKPMATEMHVRKRDGSLEQMNINEVRDKVRRLSAGLQVNVSRVVLRVCDSLSDNIETSAIDDVTSEAAMEFCIEHPDYETLAVRVMVENLHLRTPKTFSNCIATLASHGRVDSEFNEAVQAYADVLDEAIDFESDAKLSFFGLKTLINNQYLLDVRDADTTSRRPCELPCYLSMRVALAVNGCGGSNARINLATAGRLERVVQTYELLVNRKYTHATPTMFNAGTCDPQFASCFLLGLCDDSVEGIYESLKECALISKHAGGIGIHMHNLRASGSLIRSTGCKAEGLLPTLRVFNESSQLVKQSGKRPGSIAVYMSPDHADVEKFVDMRRNHGEERDKCRDLFSAMWIPDKFMRAVVEDGAWHLFSPDTAPGLSDVWGDEYDALYSRYVAEGRARKTIRARDLWIRIITAQIETGTPYMLYKDAVNRHNNQSNIGIVKSSNLCTEVTQVSSECITAVCNLASLCVSRFARPECDLPGSIEPAMWAEQCIEWEDLRSTVRVMVRSLDNAIDHTLYPTDKAKVSNMKTRPLGIGVQGWHTLLFELGVDFDSAEAAALNKRLFANIYHTAWTESARIAREKGSYPEFEGSPLSRGILHCDTWSDELVSGLDWDALREAVRGGARNSMLTTLMPTASTAQICSNTEACEPLASNIYIRRTLAGEYVQVNGYLVRDLHAMGLWNESVRAEIMRNDGSIGDIQNIPELIRRKYRTAYELSQRSVIDQARERAPYIDQSQSMNLFVSDPSVEQVSSMHMHGFRTGLKTGMYYLRSRPRARAQQFAIPPEQPTPRSCSTNTVCESCSA